MLSIYFLPQSPNEVYTFKRPVDLSEKKGGEGGGHMFFRGGLRSSSAKQTNCVSLLAANQVVRAVPPYQVPLKDVYPKGQGSNRSQNQMWNHCIHSQNMTNVLLHIHFGAAQSMQSAFDWTYCERLLSCLSRRRHTANGSSLPGGDGPELQEGQIYSCPKVKKTTKNTSLSLCNLLTTRTESGGTLLLRVML